MFFERPDRGTRTLLVHVRVHAQGHAAERACAVGEGREQEFAAQQAEFRELAGSADLEVVGELDAQVRQPDARSYVGSGKLEEMHDFCKALPADLVLIDAELSPSQERNLEKALQARVMGRTELILFIFASRARTHEGKLQVELAQLRHASTRLVRGWTHLDRQRGASGARGVVGGVGETQLALDQRMIGQRIQRIEGRLARVRRQREQGRRARHRSATHTVSVVGYTNAGKSTLFNRLTDAAVHAADQLFATLDPTLRRWRVGPHGDVVLADTVGFIRHLPHSLVDAFRATLEEVTCASLLLHVVDAASPQRDDNMLAVQAVLEEIGVGTLPVIRVYNKIDLLEGCVPHVVRDGSGTPVEVWLSAACGSGFELLRGAVCERLGADLVETALMLEPAAGRLRAHLYALGAVLSEQVDEAGGLRLGVRIERDALERILAEGGGVRQIG